MSNPRKIRCTSYCFSIIDFDANPRGKGTFECLRTLIEGEQHQNHLCMHQSIHEQLKYVLQKTTTNHSSKDNKATHPILENTHYTQEEIDISKIEQSYIQRRMEYQKRIKVSLHIVQRNVQNWLNRYFPEYQQVFKKWEGKTSLITLHKFPTPNDILRLGPTAILQCWRKEVKAAGINLARELVIAAKSSKRCTFELGPAKAELNSLLDQYQMLKKKIEEIDHELDQSLN
ncbi:hypothetical protein [Paenibacillus sp. NPDC058177]|uniref:hypothetical protein n=1 Tax=Paenibacillus sp. NPDC058177 TaxID=3346369 RepID=UPI0036DF03E6